MQYAQFQQYFGKQAHLQVENHKLSILVIVDDVKSAYGRIDFLVRPVMGDGQMWVNSDRVQFVFEENK